MLSVEIQLTLVCREDQSGAAKDKKTKKNKAHAVLRRFLKHYLRYTDFGDLNEDAMILCLYFQLKYFMQ